MFKQYPKTVELKDGRKITIRQEDKSDEEKLIEFFKKIPKSDCLYLKEDVHDENVIRRWFKHASPSRIIPLIVEHEGEIIADGTLHLDEHGWSRHVGEVRFVVNPEFRRTGVALYLVKEFYLLSLKLKLKKLTCSMMEVQTGAIGLFKNLGFEKEATLKDHIKDVKGDIHDLVIMSHSVDSYWDDLENMIADSGANFAGDFAGHDH